MFWLGVGHQLVCSTASGNDLFEKKIKMDEAVEDGGGGYFAWWPGGFSGEVTLSRARGREGVVDMRGASVVPLSGPSPSFLPSCIQSSVSKLSGRLLSAWPSLVGHSLQTAPL